MKRIFGILLSLLLIFQGVAMGQTIAPEAAIARLFVEAPLQREWFAPGFLNAIPFSQVEEIVSGLQTGLGDYQRVERSGSDFLIVFDRGSVPTKIVVDGKGQIAALWFGPPRTQAISVEEAIAQLKTFPGQTSLLALKDGEVQGELNSEAVLAVGSAFKLFVLQALKQQIDAGERAWSDTVKLQAKWKSLPSGTLQTWPDNSPLTLHSLAALMISQSDNTATDALIHLLGREAIEALTPRNRPLLTTRDFFALKNPDNRALLKEYRNGDETARRHLLDRLGSATLPTADLFEGGPQAIDVEWFFSVRELCDAIASVGPLPLMEINPGVANPENWENIAFKGGSEPGVLNMTTWVESEDGQSYCVAATWNNSEESLDVTRFQTLYSAVIEGLQ